MPTIPERQPIGDWFSGTVLRVNDTCLLARQPHSDAELIISGNLLIRYGVQYLGKPHFSIVPGLIALDYGEMLTGEAAWDFLLHHSNLHPRADVVGYRNDGRDEMIVLKLLDLAAPIQVLVYEDAAAANPIARVMALIAEDSAGISPRLLNYLPLFSSIADWQHYE